MVVIFVKPDMHCGNIMVIGIRKQKQTQLESAHPIPVKSLTLVMHHAVLTVHHLQLTQNPWFNRVSLMIQWKIWNMVN